MRKHCLAERCRDDNTWTVQQKVTITVQDVFPKLPIWQEGRVEVVAVAWESMAYTFQQVDVRVVPPCGDQLMKGVVAAQ